MMMYDYFRDMLCQLEQDAFDLKRHFEQGEILVNRMYIDYLHVYNFLEDHEFTFDEEKEE